MADIAPYQKDHVTSHILRLMDNEMINPNVYAELERMFRVGDKVLRLKLDGTDDLEDRNVVKGLHSIHAGVYSLTQNEALDLFAFLYSKLHLREYYECLVHNAYLGDMENLGFAFILFKGDQSRMEETPYCSMQSMYHNFLHSRPKAVKSEFFKDLNSNNTKGFIAPLETLLKLHNTNISIDECHVRRHSEDKSNIYGWYPLKMGRQMGPNNERTYIKGEYHYGLELKQNVPLEDLVMICDVLFEGLSAIQMPRAEAYIKEQIGESESSWVKPENMPQDELDKAFSAFGMDKTASFSEVKQSFAKMAVEYIPEKHPPEESKLWNDKLKEIIEMYKILKSHFENMEEDSQDRV